MRNFTHESDLLRHIAEISAAGPSDPNVDVGPGDDCAVVNIGGASVLVTVDQLVEGRHYEPKRTSIDLIARKAMARSVSDIAAMAGMPIAAVVAGCCRTGFPDGKDLISAIHRWGREFLCPVVGGDLASHHSEDLGMVLSVTVFGVPHAMRGPVLRSGAKPGDAVWVTGEIGGSFASEKHLRFTPRIAEAAAIADLLGERLSSMIDISDGLGRDAARIARASGVRIEIEGPLIPLTPGVKKWSDAARDGEDYELVFTATGANSDALAKLGCTRIGAVTTGEGCVLRGPNGAELDAETMGWDHG